MVHVFHVSSMNPSLYSVQCMYRQAGHGIGRTLSKDNSCDRALAIFYFQSFISAGTLPEQRQPFCQSGQTSVRNITFP